MTILSSIIVHPKTAYILEFFSPPPTPAFPDSSYKSFPKSFESRSQVQSQWPQFSDINFLYLSQASCC